MKGYKNLYNLCDIPHWIRGKFWALYKYEHTF